jgi:hypothetical protein
MNNVTPLRVSGSPVDGSGCSAAAEVTVGVSERTADLVTRRGECASGHPARGGRVRYPPRTPRVSGQLERSLVHCAGAGQRVGSPG